VGLGDSSEVNSIAELAGSFSATGSGEGASGSEFEFVLQPRASKRINEIIGIRYVRFTVYLPSNSGYKFCLFKKPSLKTDK
jgi:hypothetical protein